MRGEKCETTRGRNCPREDRAQKSRQGIHRSTGQIFMAAKKTTPAKKITKRTPAKKLAKSSDRARLAGIADDATDEKIPRLTVDVRLRKNGKRGQPRKWDYDRLMAYVCDQISEGRLVIDIARKIGIKNSKIAEIADTTDTYRVMYSRARKEQASWFAQNISRVAEGRDRITMKERKTIAKLRKNSKKDLSLSLYANAREHNIIARNRLQVDAAKWYAKVTDPERFGDKSSVSLAGTPDGEAIGITLRFVDANGKEVTP